MSMDQRQQWMAFVLQQGLEYQLISTDDVLRYATPRVIANLPVELKSRLLRSGLNQGMFNSDVVLSVLTPEVLAGNVALPTLWGCIAEAGEREFGGDSVNLTGSDIDTAVGGMGPSGTAGSAASSASSSSSSALSTSGRHSVLGAGAAAPSTTGRASPTASGTAAASSGAAASAGDPKPRPASSGTGPVRTTAATAGPAATPAPAQPVAPAAAAPASRSAAAALDLGTPPSQGDPFGINDGESMIVIEDEPSQEFATYGGENTGVDHRTLRPGDKTADKAGERPDDDRDRARKRNQRF
jgi:hypothetical protein